MPVQEFLNDLMGKKKKTLLSRLHLRISFKTVLSSVVSLKLSFCFGHWTIAKNITCNDYYPSAASLITLLLG